VVGNEKRNKKLSRTAVKLNILLIFIISSPNVR